MKYKKVCCTCKRTFQVSKYRHTSGLGKFCSETCRNIGFKKRVVRVCTNCKCKYEAIVSDKIKFCSKKCRDVYDTNRKTKQCVICKKLYKCDSSGSKFQRSKYCSIDCKNRSMRGKPNLIASKWMSENIANGNYNPISQKYKCGYYKNNSTNKKEYYASSYELKFMKYLNLSNFIWTKRHKITIPYTKSNGFPGNYVPDFFVNNTHLYEIKPNKMMTIGDNPEKFKAAIKYCKKNKLKFKVLTEKELNI